MKTQLVVKMFLTAVLLLCCQSGFVQAKVIYVDIDRPAGGDGSTWGKAYQYLQDAIAASNAGDEIRVAVGMFGTYRPDQGTGITPGDTTASFQLKEGVALYGGYDGSSGANPDERLSTTLLSGDLNGDDGPPFKNYGDNSLHVVKSNGVTNSTILDGFQIIGGNSPNNGAGMYNIGGSPQVNNCYFIYNKAVDSGAGMMNFQSSPVVTNCVFQMNSVDNAGGGMLNHTSNPVITNCSFMYNTAKWGGGGMYNYDSSPTIVNCLFQSNVETGFGGGGIHNGATLDPPTACNPVITNCNFIMNYAGVKGGGIFSRQGASPTIRNCILWGDTAFQGEGAELGIDSGAMTVIASDVQGGVGAVYQANAAILNWVDNNINADPLFEDAAHSNYHLRKGSPCVDTGETYCAPKYDYEGSPRKSSVGGDEKADIGIDELIVSEVGKTGYSYSTIQAAIDAAQTGDLVLVHDGTYVENIDFRGKAIRVRSENGAGKTTIDGNQSGSVVAFASNEVTESILDGFTITNGNSDSGGGIFCDFSSPTITNCTIAGNKAVNDGGGIRLQNSSPILTSCIITKNNASYGSGSFCQQSSPSLINCTIAQNMATSNDSGGGICVMGPSSHPTVKNSILWGDTASGAINEIFLDQNSSFSIAYSDVQGGWTGQGNINSDPLFKNLANGDYHLLAGSPCIDAANSDGAPTTDINGNIRYDDPQTTNTGAGALPYYDMGAIEYQGIVATTTTTASGGGGGGGGGGGTTTTTAVNTTTTTSVATTTTTSVIVTTTTTAVSSTTTTIETECTLIVEKGFLPLQAGLFARLRRIVIKGGNSEWDTTSQVTIDDINTVFRRVKDQETIIAWIIIPGKLIAKYEPRTKPVRVQTPGKKDCTGEIVIE